VVLESLHQVEQCTEDKDEHKLICPFRSEIMSPFLLLVVVMAAIFLQFVQAQLLPEIPIEIPEIPLEIPLLPALPLLPVAVVCPAGFFNLLTGCTPCPSGTSSLAGALACIACPPGTYAPGPGSSSCAYCGAGTFSSPAMDTCFTSPAPKGKVGPAKKGGKV
jgi:Tyrosine-protein kinase ephrin type A/B receptor-like